MYTKRNYGFWMTVNWSKKPFLYGSLYAFAVVLIHYFLKKNLNISISLPWQPISLMGIAVAFYLGFKNNASYDRIWEARKIWGDIVNSSRSFGVAVVAFIQNVEVRQEIIFRHIAWLTALRYQLRLSKEWEHKEERVKGVYYFPEASEKYFDNLENELEVFLDSSEVKKILSSTNIATQILKNQAVYLQKLRDQNHYDDFRHMELHRLINVFFDDQGRSERIKNFPFPRQYASAALWQTAILSSIIPFGLLDVFPDPLCTVQWFVVPFSGLIIWIFFLMEKIGDYSENPFEGSYNDIPITSISRSIEIDLKQMLDLKDIPPPINSEKGYLL